MGTDPYEFEHWPEPTPSPLGREPQTMLLPVAGCAVCSRQIEVALNPNGSIPLAPFYDWVFTAKDGWRCPDHGTPPMED